MIGEKIRTVRNSATLTRPELAKKIEEITGKTISDKTIGHWETNRNEPSMEMLEAICKITNTPVGYFYSEDLSESKKHEDAFIERMIEEMIAEGDITEGQSYQQLDEDTQTMLIAALNKIIKKKFK